MAERTAYQYLLEPGQEELLWWKDTMILKCAVAANLSKLQWNEFLAQVGAGNITDILEIEAEDFERCKFKPLLQRRLDHFQHALYVNHWSKLRLNPAEATTAANASEDAPLWEDDEAFEGFAVEKDVADSVHDSNEGQLPVDVRQKAVPLPPPGSPGWMTLPPPHPPPPSPPGSPVCSKHDELFFDLSSDLF